MKNTHHNGKIGRCTGNVSKTVALIIPTLQRHANGRPTKTNPCTRSYEQLPCLGLVVEPFAMQQGLGRLYRAIPLGGGEL